MSDRTRRAIRTLLQGVPPVAIVGGMVAFGVPLNEAQQGFIVLLLLALSSFLANLLEDKTGAALGPSREG